MFITKSRNGLILEVEDLAACEKPSLRCLPPTRDLPMPWRDFDPGGQARSGCLRVLHHHDTLRAQSIQIWSIHGLLTKHRNYGLGYI